MWLFDQLKRHHKLPEPPAAQTQPTEQEQRQKEDLARRVRDAQARIARLGDEVRIVLRRS